MIITWKNTMTVNCVRAGCSDRILCNVSEPIILTQSHYVNYSYYFPSQYAIMDSKCVSITVCYCNVSETLWIQLEPTRLVTNEIIHVPSIVLR